MKNYQAVLLSILGLILTQIVLYINQLGAF